MRVSREIGYYKLEHDMPILQTKGMTRYLRIGHQGENGDLGQICKTGAKQFTLNLFANKW